MRSLDDVDVVFLAWRESSAMLARHHAAVAADLGQGWAGRAVLVENDAPRATSAAARAQLRRRYPGAERVVLRAPRNLGFARAMNLALDRCAGRYALLVNPDGVPAPGMARALAEALDARAQAMWAAPAVHGPGEREEPPGPPVAEPELPGTALLVRRAAFLAEGGFDPAYFFYNEDYDASRRLRAAGHELLRVPAARFDHGRGGRSRRGMFRREHHYARTAQLLALQHGSGMRPAAGALARRRAASVAGHVRAGDWPGAAGIAAATVFLPRATAIAAARRRRPWDGERFAAWLRRARADVTVHTFAPDLDSAADDASSISPG